MRMWRTSIWCSVVVDELKAKIISSLKKLEFSCCSSLIIISCNIIHIHVMSASMPLFYTCLKSLMITNHAWRTVKILSSYFYASSPKCHFGISWTNVGLINVINNVAEDIGMLLGRRIPKKYVKSINHSQWPAITSSINYRIRSMVPAKYRLKRPRLNPFFLFFVFLFFLFILIPV